MLKVLLLLLLLLFVCCESGFSIYQFWYFSLIKINWRWKKKVYWGFLSLESSSLLARHQQHSIAWHSRARDHNAEHRTEMAYGVVHRTIRQTEWNKYVLHAIITGIKINLYYVSRSFVRCTHVCEWVSAPHTPSLLPSEYSRVWRRRRRHLHFRTRASCFHGDN